MAGLELSTVSVLLLICSICGDGFGYLALWKLTPKNDNMTIVLKFCLRFVVYFVVLLTANPIILVFAVFISIFVSRAFENVTETPYINRIRREEQFAYMSFRQALCYSGKAIGIFIAGILFPFGLRVLFGVGLVFLAIQIFLAFYLIRLRKKESPDEIIYNIIKNKIKF